MASDLRPLALLILLALAVRWAWMLAAHMTTESFDLGEANHVAMTLARRGAFADAYFPGQGPTAHLLPTSSAIAGAIYALFGYPSPAANLALASWALLQTGAVVVLLWMVAKRLGLARMPLIVGLALFALSPAYLAQEAGDFRVWEGALALCLALASLLQLLALDRDPPPGLRGLVFPALLAGAAFFVSPAVGLAVDMCWGVFALRRLSLKRSAAFAVLGAAATALFVVPWAVRNTYAMKTPVTLRSNFGLELALANFPGALNGHPRADVFNARVAQIHPYNSRTAATDVRRMGEVAYSRARGDEAKRWIAAHSRDFLLLSLRHYRQFYLPDSWQMRATIWRNFVWPRVIFIWTVTAMGIAGLIRGLSARRPGYPYLFTYAAMVGLPYALVQPVPRYSYVVYGVLLLAGIDFAAWFGAIMRRGPDGSDRPTAASPGGHAPPYRE